MDEYNDWSQNSGFSSGVPISCCQDSDNIDNAETCSRNPDNYADHLPGCFTKLDDYLDDNASKLMAVAIVIVIIMVMRINYFSQNCTRAEVLLKAHLTLKCPIQIGIYGVML